MPRLRRRAPLRAGGLPLSLACSLALSIAPCAAPPLSAQAESPESADAGEWAVFEGEEITVSRKPPESAQTDTVTRAEIDALNEGDALSVLEKALGVPVTRAGGYGNAAGFSLRGFGAGRVAILIDGMQVNSPQSGGFDLSAVDPATLEKIDVTYGGADSRFAASGAVGGTVNLVTRADTRRGFGVSFGASSLAQLPAPETRDLADSQRVSASVRSGNGTAGWSASAFANRAGNSFAYEDAAGATRRREGNLILDAGSAASFSLDLPARSSLGISVSAYAADRDIPGPVGAPASGEQSDFSLIDRARLDLRRAGSDRVSAEASVMHALSRTSWDGGDGPSTHALNAFSAMNRWSVFASDALRLTAGADGRYSVLESDNTGSVSGADGGIDAGAEWYASRRATFSTSARLVLTRSGAVPVPRVGVRWKPSDESKLEFRHNAWRVYKIPNFNDLYWDGDATARGNPDLACEDGAGVDGGVSWETGCVSAEATAYGSWHRNAIQWQATDGVWSPANVGEALFLGLDARTVAKVGERLSVSLSGSVLDTRVLTGDYGLSDGKRIPYQSALRASAEAAWSDAETDVRLRAHYEGERFTTVVNVARLDPYFTLGVSASRIVARGLTVYAEGENLLGASYETVRGYPMPRASVTVGLKASLAAR